MKRKRVDVIDFTLMQKKAPRVEEKKTIDFSQNSTGNFSFLHNMASASEQPVTSSLKEARRTRDENATINELRNKIDDNEFRIRELENRIRELEDKLRS